MTGKFDMSEFLLKFVQPIFTSVKAKLPKPSCCHCSYSSWDAFLHAALSWSEFVEPCSLLTRQWFFSGLYLRIQCLSPSFGARVCLPKTWRGHGPLAVAAHCRKNMSSARKGRFAYGCKTYLLQGKAGKFQADVSHCQLLLQWIVWSSTLFGTSMALLLYLGKKDNM